jgi:hypothetical protein
MDVSGEHIIFVLSPASDGFLFDPVFNLEYASDTSGIPV